MMENFKILRVSHLYYKGAEDDFLRKHPEVVQYSYEDSLATLLGQKINNGDGITIALDKKGHEAKEIVYDLEWLQKKWAKEKNIAYDEREWLPRILLQQIIDYKPEILFFQHFPPLNFDVWKNIRDYCPSIRCVLIHRAWPGDWQTAGAADILLVGTRKMVEQYRSHGANAHLMYHYFDETVLDKIKLDGPKHEITFMGSSGIGYGKAHAARYWHLKYLLENLNIKMWLDEGNKNLEKPKKNLKILAKMLLKKVLAIPSIETLEKFSWLYKNQRQINAIVEEILLESKELGIPEIPLCKLFYDKCSGPLYGLEYYENLSRSFISFHKHIVTAEGDVGAIRLFQATGVGSCLVTDSGQSMQDLFEEGQEVVTYSSKEEALDKIKYLLGNPKKGFEIAQRGKKRTLEFHSAIRRADELESHVLEFFKKR
jgi:spore maturation protein CgeB